MHSRAGVSTDYQYCSTTHHGNLCANFLQALLCMLTKQSLKKISTKVTVMGGWTVLLIVSICSSASWILAYRSALSYWSEIDLAWWSIYSWAGIAATTDDNEARVACDFFSVRCQSNQHAVSQSIAYIVNALLLDLKADHYGTNISIVSYEADGNETLWRWCLVAWQSESHIRYSHIQLQILDHSLDDRM